MRPRPRPARARPRCATRDLADVARLGCAGRVLGGLAARPSASSSAEICRPLLVANSTLRARPLTDAAPGTGPPSGVAPVTFTISQGQVDRRARATDRRAYALEKIDAFGLLDAALGLRQARPAGLLFAVLLVGLAAGLGLAFPAASSGTARTCSLLIGLLLVVRDVRAEADRPVARCCRTSSRRPRSALLAGGPARRRRRRSS